MKYAVILFSILLSLQIPVYASELNIKAPDFTLKSLAGNNVRLKEQLGDVILLNFWASWCGPCRQEMPELEKLHKKYQSLGFQVIGVNVEEDPRAADKVLNKTPVTFPILYDTEHIVSELYNQRGMPTTIIIDRNGQQRFLHEAYKPGYEKMYEKQIKALIRE